MKGSPARFLLLDLFLHKSKPMKKFISLLSGGVSAAFFALVFLYCFQGAWPLALQDARAEQPAAPSDPALERTRKTVRMLDDIYKSAIVLVTKHYVEEESDMPAGVAFKALFEMVKEKGWHEVSLLDASGEPINSENTPEKGFEADAVARILAGEKYVDVVETVNGKRVLRAATAIPVVMQKCVLCHENYKTAKNDQAIGALGYVIAIDE